MQPTSAQFKQVASAKLADTKVQATLANAKGKFVLARAKAIKELDNFGAVRGRFRRQPSERASASGGGAGNADRRLVSGSTR